MTTHSSAMSMKVSSEPIQGSARKSHFGDDAAANGSFAALLMSIGQPLVRHPSTMGPPSTPGPSAKVTTPHVTTQPQVATQPHVTPSSVSRTAAPVVTVKSPSPVAAVSHADPVVTPKLSAQTTSQRKSESGANATVEPIQSASYQLKRVLAQGPLTRDGATAVRVSADSEETSNTRTNGSNLSFRSGLSNAAIDHGVNVHESPDTLRLTTNQGAAGASLLHSRQSGKDAANLFSGIGPVTQRPPVPSVTSASNAGMGQGLAHAKVPAKVDSSVPTHSERHHSVDRSGSATGFAVQEHHAPGSPSEPASPMVSPTVDTQQADWQTQMSTLIRGRINTGSSNTLRVNVHPEGMGQLTISVARHADGIHIHLEGTTAAAVNLLSQHVSALTDSLRDHGIDLSDLQVSYRSAVGGQFHDFSGESSQSHQQNRDSHRLQPFSGSPDATRTSTVYRTDDTSLAGLDDGISIRV